MAKVQLVNKVKLLMWVLAAGLLLGGPGVIWAQQAVKVHKGVITVSGPGDDGLVEVSGAEGAIESGDPVRLRVMNLETDQNVLVEWNERGSFRAFITAAVGQKVRVEAYNKVAKKRSIGTFTVPQGSGAAARVGQGTGKPEAEAGVPGVAGDPETVGNLKATNDQGTVSEREAAGGKMGQRELVVLIAVIDGGTGQVLAKEQVTGIPWEKVRRAEQYKVVGNNIVRDCMAAVRSDLKLTSSGKARQYEIRIMDGEGVQDNFSAEGAESAELSAADSVGVAGKAVMPETTEKAETTETAELPKAVEVPGIDELVDVAESAETAEAGMMHRAELKKKVDEKIIPLIEEKKNLGIVVGLIDGERREVFGYGKVALEKEEVPNGESIFEIGSITKVFTAMLLALMVQEDQVKLDDPVQQYLPDGVKMPRGSQREITLEDLATHVSGLPRMGTNFQPRDRNNPYANYTRENLYEFLNGYSLSREPGDKYEYSNFGAALLGHVLALKADRDYEQLLMKSLCEPLGMKDTRIKLTQEQRKRLVTGHVQVELGTIKMIVPMKNWDFKVLAGCGALRSTANDMLRFLEANMWLDKTKLQGVIELTHQQKHKIDDGMVVGLGWHVILKGSDQEPIIWHNGQTGGYASFCGFMQNSKRAIVVLSNTAASVDEAGLGILETLSRED